MAERVFQQELIRGAYLAGFHPVPIPDPGKAARFGVKKVYDLGLLYNCIYFAVELKEVAGTAWSWSIKDLQPHQEENLLDAERKGGLGLVICNFAIRLSKAKVKKLGYETIKRAFAVRIDTVLTERSENCRTSLDFYWWSHNGCEMIPGTMLDAEGNTLKTWDPSNILADDRITPRSLQSYYFD